MNISMGGGFNTTMNSPSAAGKKKQSKRSQSIVPLVVSQITSSTDEEFTLFGRPVQIVSLVGILRNYEIQSTKATCVLNDHTGEIKALLWLEADGDSIFSLPPVKEGNYVKMFGSIRVQDGEKTVMILKMTPVDNCNVITNHLLRVINARLTAQQLSENTNVGVSLNPHHASVMGSTFADTSESFSDSGLNKLQQDILAILRGIPAHDKVGISRTGLLAKLPSYKTAEVSDAIQFLLHEGHAYTTIDLDNFKLTGYP